MRLIHEDPVFARLAAASSAEEPSNEQLEKALALATDAAAASRSLAWRSGIGVRVAIGLAVVGVAIVGIATIRGADPSRDVRSASARNPAQPATAAPVVVEPVVQAVSVRDLLDAPPASAPSSEPVATRSREARPRGPEVRTTAAARDQAAGPSSARGTFREELALVSAARASLEAGDGAACLRTLDGYDARFPSGIFLHEVVVLRIEALAASGEGARARTLADQFLATNAKSPYADRVRSSLERTRN